MSTRFGPFTIDFERQRLSAAGEEVRLRRQCWDLLALFARRAGDTLSKEEISAALWPNIAVEPNTLNVLLWDLRRSLAAAADGSFIESIGRRGYRLCLDSTTVAEPVLAPDAMREERFTDGVIGRAAEIEQLRTGMRAAAGGARQLIF